MKVSIRTHLTRASHSIWHCLWLATVFLVFTGNTAIADPYAIDITTPDPPPNTIVHTIKVVVDTPIVEEDEHINVQNAPGEVFWEFNPSPSSGGDVVCTPSTPTNSATCNGVTVELPMGAPDSPVSAGLPVRVFGTPTRVPGEPTASTSFTFGLTVAEEGGAAEVATRTFAVDIEVPFDLGFVLDRSGSMSNYADPTVPDPDKITRWQALTNAVLDSAVLANMVDDTSPPDGSRFGLTIFDGGVEFSSDLLPVDDDLESTVTEMLEEAGGPSGYTRMGLGLKDAEEKLDDCNRPRILVLFTDGKQEPEGDPSHVQLDGVNYDTTPPTAINATCPDLSDIEIISVGIIQPSSDYFTILQNLASQNGGNSVILTTTGDISSALDGALVAALSGSSPQIVAQYQDVLGGEITLTPFNLNQNVRQLILKLTFERELPRSDLEELLANINVLKDGEPVTNYFEPKIVGDTAQTIWLQSRFQSSPSGQSSLPPLPSEGSYEVQLSQPTNSTSPLPFRLASIADDSILDMRWSVAPDAPQTNQSFSPTVKLSVFGQPISNANVEALILKPGDDLGDLLAKTPGRVDSCLTCVQDAYSAGGEKYWSLLLNNPDFVDRLQPNQQTLTLDYQGDGIYSAAYNPGDISDVYQILYRITADDPNLGKIQREAIQSLFVRPGAIDLDSSSVTTVVDGNNILVYWRPMTIDGRLIGPGQASAMSVDGLDVVSVRDHQDGSYTLLLDRKEPNTAISFKFLDEEIYQGSAEQFGPTKKFPLWLVILIIVIVLLLLLLLWFWKRRTSDSVSGIES